MWYLRFSRKNGVRSVSSRQRKRCAAAPQDRRGHCASRRGQGSVWPRPHALGGLRHRTPPAHMVCRRRMAAAAPSGARLASSCSRCRPRLSCRPGARTAPPKSTLPRPHCVRSATACRHACGAHCSGRHARMAGWAPGAVARAPCGACGEAPRGGGLVKFSPPAARKKYG